MSDSVQPVKTLDDALIWLEFMARFCVGESQSHARGCVNVITDLLDDLESTRGRCALLAQKLELLEAMGRKDANG